MQDKIRIVKRIFLLSFLLMIGLQSVNAQVSSVEYGKNRVQYKKFKWNYYQSFNFNVYYYENGEPLAKFALQVAEDELPSIERFVEYSIQRRVNIVIYNTFNDMQQSNIGLNSEWISTGGTTQLVNNKVVVYFNSNHEDLRRQIREGIAKVLTQNLLFGDDIGEVAGNKALLDLPEWLVEGYIAYAAQNWSTRLDDDLKSEILSEKYKNFYQFAFERPELAGHAFWYYIEERYKKENTTYLLYLARIYKNLNKATQQVTKKKKFKQLLAEFMEYQQEKYYDDIMRRKNYPKGSEITSVEIGKRKDYFHFNVNPNKKDYSFGVVQFKQGQYKLIYNDGYNDKVLLKFGVRAKMDQINPNYPMMAWDPNGQRLSVLYEKEGRIKLFVYDVITRFKPYNRDLTDLFEQVQDMKYLLTSQFLLFSAVKNGQSDIFVYDIENEKLNQITDDVYDDLDPSFVSFANKSGIIYSSNRPTDQGRGSDTSLMKNPYNIFLITDYADNKPKFNQITQLTNMAFGNARYPMQYNFTHFTFLSDMNGIRNRYAGYFQTFSQGLDTLVMIGDEMLKNPTEREVDSTLKSMKRTDVDSIAVVAMSNDTAYVFPITNYESGIRETRSAGTDNVVSEVTRQSDEKIVFKLKIDEAALKRRNVNARPTAYMRHLMEQRRLNEGEEIINRTPTKIEDDIFQHQFEPKPGDSLRLVQPKEAIAPGILSSAKKYRYKPLKFSTDYVTTGFNNTVLGTRYQPYQGGNGPINLTSDNGLNGMLRVGISDVMEDIKFSGGVRISTNLKDHDWLFQFSNLRRRWDWGLTYFRQTQSVNFEGGNFYYPGKTYSNLYQFNVSYPFDVARSVRINVGMRSDKLLISSVDMNSIGIPAQTKRYGLIHAEYVYDNTITPTENIWNGVRYKVYGDYSAQISKITDDIGRNTFNMGFDGRVYYPIYRNFIWAGRAAADFSWGNQKLIYYLGGVDNWLKLGNNQKLDKNGNIKYKFFNPANRPAPDQTYAFQSLAVNLRGFIQNAANGNNAMVLNSEFRLPVFTTFIDKPINNAFIRNFQLTQFFDFGTAWNGAYDKLKRPSQVYGENEYIQVNIEAPGLGPFLGGYGFGARSTLLGHFVKLDAGWPMTGFFRGKPIWYISLGLDF